ncbi:rhodanese-like domain-containing protein [Nocardia asteroides]
MSTGAEEMVERARARLERVTPEQAATWQSEGGLIVDIRPQANRTAEGEIPGAVVVERIVLEWRLDPNGDHRLPDLTADTPVVIVCNEGYASSLAAAEGLGLGLRRVTDLVGGFRAWKAAGLPVVPGGTPAVP